ncbi:MAG TPA: bifunctional ornithine acetyltransferase/N-acetylglutamate synthase [Candidatus Sulfotelmatobacter sp.]|nr:bifunctional ornithine acetyltransferase/N-acetylglutamate synthase [Candidatus Sulfotelmatobacter sp.]
MTATEPGADVAASAAADLVGALPSALPPVARTPVLPGGFLAGGLSAGIKASGRPDLALFVVGRVEAAGDGGVMGRPVLGAPAAVAALFTRNRMAAAPVRLSQANLLATDAAGRGRRGWASAIVSTSGSANAATGAAGDADQAEIAAAVAHALGTRADHTLTLSTGVIGTRLPVARVAEGIGRLLPAIGGGPDALLAAANALRTTDSTAKVATTSVDLPAADGSAVTVRVSGVAKGVGMIHPGMATMLAVLMTDAAVDPATLEGLLRPAAARTWNQLSVDGDTSTNDTVFLLASGVSAAALVQPGTSAAARLGDAVTAVARDLARQQAADGEGAGTLITCQVSGAADDAEARAVARTVVASSLVKAAAHGGDPNWGRIAGAAGNAALPAAPLLENDGLAPAAAAARAGQPVALDPDRLRIAIAGYPVFDGRAGGPLPFDRSAARAAMDASELLIRLDLGLGTGAGEAFGCDLTEAYVRENAEYTT